MSTKIYSGFKYDTSNFGDVQSYVNNWRSRIGALALEKANMAISKRVVKAIDTADIRKALFDHGPDEIEREHDGPLYVITKEMRDQAREDAKNGYRNVELDFDFEVDLIYHENAFYGVVRTDQHDWEKAWVSSERAISDYSYWDNSDRPEGVSASEWRERADVWKALLKDAGWRPAYAGFTCVINNSKNVLYKMGNPAEVAHFQKSFEDRLEGAVKTAFLDRYVTRPGSENFQVSEFMAERSRVMEMFKSGEYADEVAELTETCRSILRPRITESDLSDPYQPRPTTERAAQGPSGP